MYFSFKTGFDQPKHSNNLGDEFLIMLTFDPGGMVRVTTLGRWLGAPPHPLKAHRSNAKAASGRETLLAQ
jgi:hypothetical protein